jgi:Uma2 family endonuclease
MRAHLQRMLFSEDEYFAMEAASTVKSEFIDGAIYAMAGGNEDHALVGLAVGSTLRTLLGRGPCRAYSSDLRVYSPVVRTYVYPDATVICGPVEKSSKKNDRLSVMNPVVVVEVISEGTEDYDRNDKVAIYKAIPSVRDYLIVDPDARTVEHYARDDADAWRLTMHTEGDVALVGVPIALPLREIFADLDARPL